MAIKFNDSRPLIVCDLDGTLLRDDGIISEYSKTVIDKVRQNGVEFCLASGRPSFMQTVYQNAMLGLDSLQIAYNGALVTKPSNGEVLYRAQVPYDPAEKYLRFCWDTGLDFGIFTEHHVYFRDSPDRKKYYAAYNMMCDAYGQPHVNLIVVEDFSQVKKALKAGVLRISVIHCNKIEETELLGYFLKNPDGLDIVNSLKEVYDVIPKGTNKWKAIQFVARHLGTEPDKIHTFGNDPNDIEMMRNAQHSYAVNNAMPEVLCAAKTIIPSNNDDGVAKTLERLFL